MNSLFRKRNKGKYSPTVRTRSVSNKELSELIEQLQKNADQVERNIVDTEAKMQREIFPTQGSNPGLPHCRQTLYHLSHQGSS